jgi:hypothetical protein
MNGEFMKMRPNYMLRVVSPLRSRSLLAFTLGTLCAVLLFGGCTFSDGKSTGTRHPNTARGEAALQLSKPEPKQGIALRDSPQLLVGNRTVFGSVKAIQGGQIKVEYADSLQPRYLPLSVAEAKGIQVRK